MLTIADYAAVRPDGTLDVVRGGQSFLVLPESRPRVIRAIGFQLFMSETDLITTKQRVRLTFEDEAGTIVGGAESSFPSAGSSQSIRGDGQWDSIEQFPAAGTISTELTLAKGGRYRLKLSIDDNVIGEQWILVLVVPDEGSNDLPPEVIEAVQGLSNEPR